MPQLVHRPNEKTQLQRELHSFNNQVFRVSLLSESLQWKLKARGDCDQPITELLQQIRQAVQDVAQSAKTVNELVKEASTSP